MFDRLKRLYEQGRLTDAALERAVGLGWITEEEKQIIIEAAARTGKE